MSSQAGRRVLRARLLALAWLSLAPPWVLMLVYPGDSKVVDLDGDGFAWGIDCDDRDPAATPGAIEVTGDGVDNDCDPATADSGENAIAVASGAAP